MRTMLRISIPVDAGNKALKDDVIPKLIQQTTELLKPEGAYFTCDHGVRTTYFFFDMKEATQMPAIAEPWFMATNAKVELLPVMNAEELRTGLERLKKK